MTAPVSLLTSSSLHLLRARKINPPSLPIISRNSLSFRLTRFVHNISTHASRLGMSRLCGLTRNDLVNFPVWIFAAVRAEKIMK